MSIPPRFMSELRDRLTLSEIVGRKVRLTRAGREFKGCCPFHKEKTPSFTVNDDKHFYHCFGCGAHGDAVEFVMQQDNLSFIEAVETLAAQAGMEVPEQTPQEVAQAKLEKSLHSLMDEAANFFAHVLYNTKEGGEPLAYVRDRGMGAESLTAFRIGYSPSDGQALRRWLKDKGYTDEQMVEAGVIRRSTRGGEPYSFFRERLMFPVTDKRGRVVAFGGRILPGKAADDAPKYINSSDSALFHKGRMLYAESHARAAAAEGQPVIVVEGYMDVMACWQAGFKGAVAPLGTALTEDQIIVLWKMSATPILCFDGDKAGRRAAARACERILPLLKPDHSARFAFLPDGQDPDSLLRGQGRGALQAVLDGALPMADFVWNHHAAGHAFDTPETRAGLSKTLEDETARIADRGVQHYYRQAFRDRLFKAFGWKGNKDKSRKGKKAALEMVFPRLGRPAFSETTILHQILLATVINYPEILPIAEESLGSMHIENKRLDLVRQNILNIVASGDALDREMLVNHLTVKGFGEELVIILSEGVYTHAGFARPGREIEAVREGWQETWQFSHRLAAQKELLEASQALAQDMSEENEEKWRALHDVNKAAGE